MRQREGCLTLRSWRDVSSRGHFGHRLPSLPHLSPIPQDCIGSGGQPEGRLTSRRVQVQEMKGCFALRTWQDAPGMGPLGPQAFFPILQAHSREWIRSGDRTVRLEARGRSDFGTPRGAAPSQPYSPAVQPSVHALGAGTPGRGTPGAVRAPVVDGIKGCPLASAPTISRAPKNPPEVARDPGAAAAGVRASRDQARTNLACQPDARSP